jgi:hypothetical protein
MWVCEDIARNITVARADAHMPLYPDRGTGRRLCDARQAKVAEVQA